jgi:sulfite reductase alpha subunit-like flavoprotein
MCRVIVLCTGAAVGENTFYFGCRHEKKDYLYGELWPEMVAQGHLHRLHTAFSRDQVSAGVSAPLTPLSRAYPSAH